jgi:hypothetical protein
MSDVVTAIRADVGTIAEGLDPDWGERGRRG